MSIWTPSTIQRFIVEGEQVVATTLKCIIARSALDIVSGTGTYSLPSDLYSIRRVTWLGKKLNPMPARDYHKLNVVTASAEPLFYVFNQQGKATIRLYPIPNQTVATVGTGLFGANIGTAVIVEYYQLPDSSTVKLPLYIRRRLIKYYVLHACFSQEGKGQNLKVAKKMKERFDLYMNIFKKIHAQHFVAELNCLGQGNKRGIMAPPRLSYSFGESGEF